MKRLISESDYFKKYDLLPYLMLFFILVLFFPFFKQKEGKYVNIYVNGSIVKKMSLSRDTTLTFSGYKGPFTVRVEKGKIKMLNSTCPLKVCVKEGFISRAGESIVCVPNRVTIYIEGSDLDAISE